LTTVSTSLTVVTTARIHFVHVIRTLCLQPPVLFFVSFKHQPLSVTYSSNGEPNNSILFLKQALCQLPAAAADACLHIVSTHAFGV